jgi:ferritin-like metal-binding protein YciE
MDIQKAQDLFVHMLGVQYNADQKCVRFLSEVSKNVEDPQVKSALEQWANGKQQQVQNLEKCFRAIGMQPRTSESMIAESIFNEYRQNVSQIRLPAVKTLYTLTVARDIMGIFVGRYAILTRMARMSGNDQLWQPLEQNLQMEQGIATKWDQWVDRAVQQVSTGAGPWIQPYAGGPSA